MKDKVRKPIRVALRLTLDVDVDRWNAEYSTADTPAEVREQVISQAVDAVVIAFNHLGGAVVLE